MAYGGVPYYERIPHGRYADKMELAAITFWESMDIYDEDRVPVDVGDFAWELAELILEEEDEWLLSPNYTPAGLVQVLKIHFETVTLPRLRATFRDFYLSEGQVRQLMHEYFQGVEYYLFTNRYVRATPHPIYLYSLVSPRNLQRTNPIFLLF